MVMHSFPPLIPAKAGTQTEKRSGGFARVLHPLKRIPVWVPAFAGMSGLLFASAAFAAQPVALKPDLTDADGRVTLSDLFEATGRAGAVVVAPGPKPGLTAVLDAGQVQRIAREHGLEWANPTGFRRLVVRGAEASAASRAGSVEVLTYARSLNAGEIVRAEDVVWSKVQAHLAPADAPNDAEAVIGQAARRPVRSGAVVAPRDLAAPQVIKRGEAVSIAYRFEGVNLVLQGEALENASVGEAFSVLNTQSKKTIEAVAAGPGRAVVGPEADSLKAARFASR